MIKQKHLSKDAINLHFIQFALKNNAKKWLYSMSTDSITSWGEFNIVFLKKYYPTYKATEIRNAIN